jgi:hypothetical protein
MKEFLRIECVEPREEAERRVRELSVRGSTEPSDSSVHEPGTVETQNSAEKDWEANAPEAQGGLDSLDITASAATANQEGLLRIAVPRESTCLDGRIYYNTHESIYDAVRKQLEIMDAPGGFEIVHGTHKGVALGIIEMLKEECGKTGLFVYHDRNSTSSLHKADDAVYLLEIKEHDLCYFPMSVSAYKSPFLDTQLLAEKEYRDVFIDAIVSTCALPYRFTN